MTRVVSFLVLVGFILVFAALFYQVIAPFLLPVFLAGVLALLFRPWYEWFTARFKGRLRLAAGVTTAAVVLSVLIPVGGALSMATVQLLHLLPRTLRAAGAVAPQSSPPAAEAAPGSAGEDSPREAKQPTQAGSPEGPVRAPAAVAVREWRDELIQRAQGVFPVEADQINRAIDSAIETLARRTLRLLGDLVAFVVGLLITVIALYFFFLDGPRMVETVQRLTPLDNRHERELLRQFDTVCRAVVFATLASAIVQGLLAGIGFLIVGLHRQVFVLSILTTLFAMIPFVGTVAVWLPTAAVLWWLDLRWQAIFLAVYGVSCITTVDNLIKPYILHGRAKLHPLLALLSVLGGVQALGLSGIFIGPMVAAFLYALLNILHQELQSFAETDRRRAKQPASDAPPEPAKAKPAARTVRKKQGKSRGRES